MKTCPNCNRTYENEMHFCTNCGTTLASAMEPNTFTAQPSLAAANGNVTFTSAVNSGVGAANQSGLIKWAPYILAVVGFIIAWNINAVFGFILTLAGLGIAFTTKGSHRIPFVAIAVPGLASAIIAIAMAMYL